MRILFILISFFSFNLLLAQDSSSFWESTNEAIIDVAPDDRTLIPDEYGTFYLDTETMKAELKAAPMEFTSEARSNPMMMDLPMPDGSLVTFAVSESPVMKPNLAKKYSEIKTYSGYSTSEPGIKLKFVLSPIGFSGAMTHLLEAETYYIDSYAKGNTDYYISYNVKDHHPDIPEELRTCALDDSQVPIPYIDPVGHTSVNHTATSNDDSAGARGDGELVNLRVYTVAITTTGEWAQDISPSGNIPTILAKITEGVVRLNQIFEVDLALRLIMAEDSDQLIFTDPDSDPFLDSNASGLVISQNTGVISDIIGFENFDIGHVFNDACDTGGLASLGAVCTANKGSAITCHYTSNFEFAVTQIVAHEMGHSFDAPHTMSRCQLNDLDNVSVSTDYEPGSGNTIMSYYGVCNPSQDVANGPHDYYHVNSLERMYNFTGSTGSNCPETTLTDNHCPILKLNYEDGFHIPIGTPFELTADAEDEDNDNLTYCWEQYNGSIFNSFLGSPQGNDPSFRSFPPMPSPTRIFPRMQNIVTNTTTSGEVLPTYTRNLKFRCSVRDNNPIIGVATWAEMSFEATEEAGPFRVTFPNFFTTWTVGEDVEVTWNVANTDGNLVDCQFVNILLSTDGGYNYPITLAEGVPNDGSRIVVVPQEITSTARIRIEAADNIFFDISNANFEIIENTVAGFNFDAGPYEQQVCTPEDPSVELPMISILGFDDPVTFEVLSGLPVGAIADFSTNPATPTEGTALSIDMSSSEPISGYYELVIQGMIEGVDTHVRTVYLDVVSTDFTDLALATPTYGELGVGDTPSFEWDASGNAATYEFQLATNPSFSPGTIVDEGFDLTDPNFLSDQVLDKSTPYYWRVRPINRCGAGSYTQTFAFHTEVFACADYISTTSVNISSQGTPTVESSINVPQGGDISDINVTKIRGEHDLVKHLAVSLVSPSSTEIELFSGICQGSNSSLFNLGIDDNSPLPITCPPNSGAYMQPESANALAGFNGEPSQGFWTLKVKVINQDGNGGALEDWALQICSNTSAAAPFLVTNETLLVPPGEFNYILVDQLLSEDSDNAPNELTYTLVEAPQQGGLIFNGVPVEVGDVFRQSSINAANVTYQHTAGAEETDQFVFTVSDGDGGWIPPTVFQIQVDEDAVVSTENILYDNELLVFPNPTKDLLNIKLSNPVNADVDVRLYNVQGQLVASQMAQTGMDVIQFNTNQLSAGLYFVELNIGKQSLVEKVAVYK
ncbi:MAG: reprolysin-like metallopeptidase [Saprospiraceae bacterium]